MDNTDSWLLIVTCLNAGFLFDKCQSGSSQPADVIGSLHTPNLGHG